jgi:hypothetical protein
MSLRLSHHRSGTDSTTPGVCVPGPCRLSRFRTSGYTGHRPAPDTQDQPRGLAHRRHRLARPRTRRVPRPPMRRRSCPPRPVGRVARGSRSVATLIPRTGYRTVAASGKPIESAGAWVSPDGRLLAVGNSSDRSGVEGDCLLWDVVQGRELARLTGICAQFSADSETLFTFERFGNNRVRSFDVSATNLANPPAGWETSPTRQPTHCRRNAWRPWKWPGSVLTVASWP